MEMGSDRVALDALVCNVHFVLSFLNGVSETYGDPDELIGRMIYWDTVSLVVVLYSIFVFHMLNF